MTVIAPIGNRNLDRSADDVGSNFRLVLVCMVVFIDFLGVTMPTNILPVMIDQSAHGHLVGCEGIPEGTAISIAAFTYAVGVDVGRSCSPPCLAYRSLTSYKGSATDYWWFTFFRFLTGLSGGGRPVAMAYVTDTLTDTKRRTLYFSYINMIPGLCFGLGPAFGGLLAFFSLSAPFYFVSAWAVVVFTLLYLYLPESLHPSKIAAKRLGSNREALLPELIEDNTELDCHAFTLLYFVSFYGDVHGGGHWPDVSPGVSNLGDGTLIILGTFVYIYLANEAGYSSSFLGASSLLVYGMGCLFLPATFHTLWLFLTTKWILLGVPPSLTFAALPIMVAEFSPKHRSGELMGYFTLFSRSWSFSWDDHRRSDVRRPPLCTISDCRCRVNPGRFCLFFALSQSTPF
ncbi:hypothetical protein FOZ60_007514 [Perkinsus olseni]|uniref:Major facilitator superfamily (MFS) profile domain-containing protein n=1 Tax=Perkinsus olseni TaxID=32597 RepID=A0A7J6PMT9_PEROL|nr:hypothetical protein FOZ60_007514 [Perkinsus olseni]